MGIIAVSDVHLGYMNPDDKKESLSNKDDFEKFLDMVANRDGIDKLVLCGDVFDMWARDMVGVFIENADILYKLQMLQSKMEVYYVIGNHDYYVRKLKNFRYQFSFYKGDILTLQDSGTTYRFKHGYDFEPIMNEIYFDALCYSNDELGNIASRAYKVWTNWYEKFTGEGQFESMLEPAKKRLSPAKITDIELRACRSVKDGEILVFGHTHKPFINKKGNVVNLGSWTKDSEVPNTYLEVKDGKMKLKKFPGGKEITDGEDC